MKIGFCTFEKFDNRPYDTIGSTRIRARWLMKYWPEAEEYIIGRKYDALIFQKVYWKEMMKQFDGIKIMDLCDPDWLEGKPVMEYVNLADACVTSSQVLANYILQFCPDKIVKFIPDRVDLEAYPCLKKEHKEKLDDVVWFGYSQNFHYLLNTLDALTKRNIKLTVVSERVMEIPAGFPGMQVNCINYVQATIGQEIAKHDAVLLPDPSTMDERGKFKSDNKVTQSWALGMPVIRVEDDLDRLATKEARETESRENRSKAERLFDVKLSVEEYKTLIAQIQANRGDGSSESTTEAEARGDRGSD